MDIQERLEWEKSLPIFNCFSLAYYKKAFCITVSHKEKAFNCSFIIEDFDDLAPMLTASLNELTHHLFKE